MSEQKVVVCRTHFVDPRLMAFARGVEAHPDYRVVFAVDESHGTVDTGEFGKLVLSREAFGPLGLFTEIGDIFWRCGDYPLYLARRRFPECDTFWLCEYDVTINRPEPVSFLAELDAAHDHDFLSTHFRRADDWWPFRHAMEGRYERVWRSYFPLVRLSGRGLDFAMAKRAQASAEMRAIPPGHRPEWPNDEVFIATELQNNGFRCADYNELGRHYTYDTFWMTVLLHPTHLPPHDGLIYHAVRSGAQYLKMVSRQSCTNPLPRPQQVLALAGQDWALADIVGPLKETFVVTLHGLGDNPRRVLAADGAIAQALAADGSEPVLRAVALALAESRMVECLDVLRRWQVERWWPRPELLDNLALGKPAWQSSTSRWSVAMNPRLDAEGGNNGELGGDFGFHTEAEPQPWWTVDLLQPYRLREVRVHNRRIHAERLNRFRLLGSLDGAQWRVLHESPPGLEFASDTPMPVRVEVAGTARLIRLQVPHAGYLHVRELEAYGEPAS